MSVEYPFLGGSMPGRNYCKPISGDDENCVNAIRFLSIDAIENAKSGHPGLPLGAAPMAYVLWTRFLRHNPNNPRWFDRDRFVLSAGHGSSLLYSLLYLTGYGLTLDDLKEFRQMNSRTPGHPERGITPGVETTTGPLGQGIANAVGMAMAEAHLSARYNRPGYCIIDHDTYCLVGDGDLMEGVASEAISLAGHLRLHRLICLFDDNRISLAGSTSLSTSEDTQRRFEASGWQVLKVADGNDICQIERVLHIARAETARPTLIIVRTHIGFGSPKCQDTFAAHGSPLGPEETLRTKQVLGWPLEPTFFVPPNVLEFFRQSRTTGDALEVEWLRLLGEYTAAYPELAKELLSIMAGENPTGWDDDLPVFPADVKGMSTRLASGTVLNALAHRLPRLLGGSADLNPSTQTGLKRLGDFQPPGYSPDDRQGAVGDEWGYGGRNIHFGVREHAMAATMNGMAVHGGIIPFGATFLVFSDYLRPALRLAALMEVQVIHLFTHDSVAVGEDGPTHQPVEHLAALRAMPNLQVIRPADANETVVAWKIAIETTNRPTALILSRQNLPVIDRNRFASPEGVRYGGYILADCNCDPELVILATGSEVALALEVFERLTEEGVPVRVVSLPSWDLFQRQPQSYREAVLPPGKGKRLALEAGSSFGWERFAGADGKIISVDEFGTSAPGEAVLRRYGFSFENVYDGARKFLSSV